MIGRTPPAAVAFLAALAVLSATRGARAVGPVDIEIAAKGGYTSSPLSEPGISSPGNPLGGGVGGRAGIVLKDGIYVGGSVVEYLTGSEMMESITPGGGVAAGTLTSYSTHVLLYGAETGYGVKLLDVLTLRPQLGFGDATFHVSGQQSTTTWYLEPGVTGLVSFGLVFVGADVGMLLMPLTQPQAAFVFQAQVGVRF